MYFGALVPLFQNVFTRVLWVREVVKFLMKYPEFAFKYFCDYFKAVFLLWISF